MPKIIYNLNEAIDGVNLSMKLYNQSPRNQMEARALFDFIH